jgi:hypothetical protein
MKYNSSNYPMVLYKIYDSLKVIKNFFFNRYPINKKDEQLSCDPFFIIGSGRSGNTLLRTVLCNHSKISIPPESYVISNMVRKYQKLNFLDWKELIKIIIGELESHDQFYTWKINLAPVYERLLNLAPENRSLAKIIDEIYCYYSEQNASDFVIWGDKTPLNTLNLGWIDKIFYNSRYIHVIRDGRDVVSSYLKMGRYDKIEDACWRWNKSINLAKKFGCSKSEEEYIEIRYEDFVSDPAIEVEKICNLLGINFNKQMINHREKVSELGDTSELSHHSNLSKPINTDSIGKWRKNLSKKQKQKAINLMKDNLNKLGYTQNYT